MGKKRARSRGVRNPVRNAVVFGLVTVAGIVLAAYSRLVIGVLPALLGGIFFVYYATRIGVFREMQSGRTAIARWTVPAEEFKRFCEEEQRIPPGSVMVNFYKPPSDVPAEGVEVIFSDTAVLIGGGYFPLSVHGGRRLQSVRYIASNPPTLEFGTAMRAAARTSSATINSSNLLETLRVPVAAGARNDAGTVADRYREIIERS